MLACHIGDGVAVTFLFVDGGRGKGARSHPPITLFPPFPRTSRHRGLVWCLVIVRICACSLHATSVLACQFGAACAHDVISFPPQTRRALVARASLFLCCCRGQARECVVRTGRGSAVVTGRANQVGASIPKPNSNSMRAYFKFHLSQIRFLLPDSDGAGRFQCNATDATPRHAWEAKRCSFVVRPSIVRARVQAYSP